VNGLSISREYFIAHALPSFEASFPEIIPRLAAGLVGNGSECFGFDDMISRDHDWGADFFLWLPEDLRDAIPDLAAWKTKLLRNTPPDFPRTASEYGASINIQTVGDFYKSMVGLSDAPQTLGEWINAPEENFAMATNGEVFLDNLGKFTQIRVKLLDYYPEDLRLKRLSYNCMTLAQTGQYNFTRCVLRNDVVAARSALTIFCDAAIAATFLLNRRFRPYYKWRFRAMLDLPILARDISDDIRTLAAAPITGDTQELQAAIERMCAAIARELCRENLCETREDFMTAHGEELRAKITNKTLRELPAQYDI
jgi:hypothetical protein